MIERARRLIASIFTSEISADLPYLSQPQVLSIDEEVETNLRKDNIASTSLHLTESQTSLLETAFSNWKSNNWDALLALEESKLAGHPARATLAAFAAAGRIQVSSLGEASRYLKLALKWGCSKNILRSILLSGAHETLGRAFTLTNRTRDAGHHFKAAKEIILDGSKIETDSVTASMAFLGYCENLIKSDSQSIFEKSDESLISQRNANLKFIHCEYLTLPNGTSSLSGRKLVKRNISYSELPLSLEYREKSDGDIGVIKQIFDEKQYEFGWLPQGKSLYELHSKIVREQKKPLIIDAGANIGASTLWFNLKFKSSTVLAIEPDTDNSELIKRNCAGKDVLLYVGGLADKIRTLYFDDPGEGDWGFRLAQHGTQSVPCGGVYDFLNSVDSEKYSPLILKVDIEGGEAMAFSGECDWLAYFPMVIIELHDWMLPNQKTSKNFLEAATRHGLEIICRGENLLCFNQKLLNKKN